MCDTATRGDAQPALSRDPRSILYQVVPPTMTTVFPFGFFGRTEHL
jgi:hypothetical protein